MLAKLSQPMKQRTADEVLERLEGRANANVSEQRGMGILQFGVAF